MTPIPKWFERSFDLNFPASLYPNLCARLRGTPARLEELTVTREPALLTRRPPGHWSAQEHAGHLLVLEPLWLARVEDYCRQSPELTSTDLRNRATDEANFNARELPEILDGFRAARARLLARLAELDESLWSRSIPHPRLRTPLRLVDHLYFVAEHDDHHLATIWELLQPEE